MGRVSDPILLLPLAVDKQFKLARLDSDVPLKILLLGTESVLDSSLRVNWTLTWGLLLPKLKCFQNVAR